MGLYSAMVLLPLLFGLWADRHRRGYKLGGGLVLFSHACLLYGIRSVFPFKTVLTIIPIALIESVILAALMLKLLGDKVFTGRSYFDDQDPNQNS